MPHRIDLRRPYLALSLLLLLVTGMETLRAEPPGANLPLMLDIRWRKGPNLPQGFQDSQGGVVEGHLITVAGFCSGEKNVPGKPDAYPRGFLKKTWGLELSASGRAWRKLPDFPGAARQGMQAVVVNDRLYCWGGFSYSEPYCYTDGYVLSRKNGGWSWEELPALPRPATAAGMVAVGSQIYLCGGADYNAERFYTATDRNGHHPNLGAEFYEFDVAHPESGWKKLTPCPGVPRWVHAMAAIGDELYLFGGATGSDNPAAMTYTVVDNWRYSLRTAKWERLADLPVASGNFPSGAIVYQDRYILLVGGYQYSQVLNPDGSTRPVYGQPTRHYADNPMCSDIFVYDTQSQTFGKATPLPLNNNLPMTVLHENRLHLIGGEAQHAVIEGEHYGHHPDLYLVGTIQAK